MTTMDQPSIVPDVDSLTERARPVSLPAPECDVLTGLAQISAWMGLSVGQCRQRVESGAIPTFRIGAKPTVYALKSDINAAALKSARHYQSKQLLRTICR